MPAHASTYFEETKTCPVGGETFKYMALGSISQWGALPDGMPLGSGRFPNLPPQCPGNGLVMYRAFTAQDIAKLVPYVAGADYKALRTGGETPYYLAYRTAVMLGDADAPWLLLSASWEAKNKDPDGPMVKRYNEEFVTAARATPGDPRSFETIALRFRTANALRELGRWDEAEALRASIVVSADTGGQDTDAQKNRAGWTRMIAALQAPILRKDQTRAPIDMLGDRQIASRCLAKEIAETFKAPTMPPPLSPFETDYCARPEHADAIREQREWLKRQGG
jgi:hypothetical protein